MSAPSPLSPWATRWITIAGALLVLLAANITIAKHENTLATGKTLYLQLAPVDPRSLMQGDYMALRFALQVSAADAAGTPNTHALFTLDEKRRAVSVNALTQASPAPLANQLQVKVRTIGGAPALGPNGFFFQEGHAKDYERAQWGEFRVSAAGDALLVALADTNLQRVGAENKR